MAQITPAETTRILLELSAGDGAARRILDSYETVNDHERAAIWRDRLVELLPQ
jgi:hypothetical protein